MTEALFALAMLIRTPIPDAPTRADLEMMRAVEDFCHTPPPEPYAAMIARLGSSKYRDREAASKALESAVRRDRSAVRWLFAGRRSRDPEVAARCNGVIRRTHPCADCKGMGRSNNWSDWPCDSCRGWGSDWPWSPWD